ncbi:MbtH family NRPS accessory protein [Pseudomonas sp. 15A4]|jgi:MbtH protein|uniref:Protein MbtH n=1 Tax=Pseudomonas graminis TaxID=158627 RepID=A0A6M8MVC9_9PSED|nr:MULTISPECIES: MbtH family NRPS accessory protein [Pseudomonas]MDC6378624.1 MbtH family NRPS accessory protein [Pseudomonas graminis]QKF52445.1 Protein MbtH [Pseudomonas graminis]QSB18673.1 MbtH family NRPS accessory protein [Pseudomonas sp. 15A4]
MSFDSESTQFRVVINHEEQYSIWPDYKAIPDGWKSVGVEGDKQTCLNHIESVWTDMRPLSLRKAMA